MAYPANGSRVVRSPTTSCPALLCSWWWAARWRSPPSWCSEDIPGTCHCVRRSGGPPGVDRRAGGNHRVRVVDAAGDVCGWTSHASVDIAPAIHRKYREKGSMSDAQAADPKGGGRNQCTCPAEPLRKHTGPYHNGQCSPGFAISLSAPDTTNADNVLAIAKRATSGDTVAPLSRTCTQMDSVSGERHAD